jgi:hypothetical protein
MSVGTMMMRRVVFEVRCDWSTKSVTLDLLVNLEHDSKRERGGRERGARERERERRESSRREKKCGGRDEKRTWVAEIEHS